ncbi:MAG: XisI protein [Desulfobacterales bacterium]
MDKTEHYRGIVKNLVHKYAEYRPSHGQIDTEVVTDLEKDHYEVLHIGWDGVRRVHGSVIHIDIIGDKIWIQHDGTSLSVAEELTAAGIPKESIVLGFFPAEERIHTGYAAA